MTSQAETLPAAVEAPVGSKPSASAALKDLFVHALVQLRVFRSPYAGIMHLFLFWGVTIQILGTAVNLMQMKLFTPFELASFPRESLYLGYELAMDLAGGAILLGVAMALWRRLVLRPATLPNTLASFVPPVLLLLIALAGFLTEALRFVIVDPPWRAWSPIGNVAAGWLTALGVTPQINPVIHEAMVWTHAALGVALVACVPFTKLRHLVVVPLHIVLRPRLRTGTLPLIQDFEQAETLGVGAIREFEPSSLLAFDACLQCGRCTAACPMYLAGMPHAPHALLRDLRTAMVEGLMEGYGKDPAVASEPLVGGMLDPGAPWFCTTCGACVAECPALIRPLDTFVDLRRYGVMTSGDLPKSIGDALKNLERQGNPWGMAPEDRAGRARELGLHTLAPGDETDVLYYMGCAAAFDERTGRSARAFVELARAAGIDLAVLADETCCGEQARRLGHEYMFQEMARQNIDNLGAVRYRRIVTQCPHCYNTMKHEYAQLGAHLEVMHYSEFLTSIRDRLPSAARARRAEGDRVTYHDSCYLGRYNQIYDEPRRLLESSGLRLTEMRRSRAGAMCCGGGGGQMWQETPPDQRINNARLEDAVAVDATVVATACPYCLQMIDDAIRSTDRSDRVKVLDIAEILADRLTNGERGDGDKGAPPGY